MSLSADSPNLSIQLWNLEPTHLHRGTKMLGYLLIAAGSLAIITDVALIVLSSAGILPATGFWGWVGTMGSLRTLVLTGCGMSAFAVGTLVLSIGKQSFRRRQKKTEFAWIQSNISQKGVCFAPNDPPPFSGCQWEKMGVPRVLVISSKNGGGHKTASEAVEAALCKDYFVRTVYPTDKISANEWYNWCQKGGWKRLQSALVNFQPFGEKLGIFSRVHKTVWEEILLFKPQVIISTQPISNSVTASFADKLSGEKKLPFVICATDFRSYPQFYYGFEKSNTEVNQGFRVALPLEDESEKLQLIHNYNFLEHIAVTDYPVRPSFQQSMAAEVDKKITELKSQWKIEENEQVVMMQMGAQGGLQLKHYCQALIKKEDYKEEPLEKKRVVFVLCGQNDELKAEIETITSEHGIENLVIHPIGNISDELEMAAYTKMANVELTKPGGASCAEAMAVGTFLFLDKKSASTTPWEEVNMVKMAQRGFGISLDESSFVSSLNNFFKGHIQRVDPHPNRFGEKFKMLIDELKDTYLQNTGIPS